MTLQKKQINLPTVSAILLCAMIVSTVLLSGSEGGSTVNYGVTAVFVAVALGTALLEKKPFLYFPEILLLMLWLCYSILPSMGAQSLEAAQNHVIQMFQIVIVVLLSVNVMIWHGRTLIFALVFFTSAVVAYLASLAGFGFGIIDASLLQELNSGVRITGTHGNANQFAMVCLLGQLAAAFFGVQAKNVYATVAAGLAITVLGVAIINTGSRTALIGMVFFIFGLMWVFRVWRLRYMAHTVLILGVIGLSGTVAYLALEENDAFRTRIDSYLENEAIIGRYENLLRLIVNVGDVDSVDTSIEGSVSDRARLMKHAWTVATEQPLGLGLDNFKVISKYYAHSNYFELLATTGFPGLILYLAIYMSMLGRLLAFVRHRAGTKPMVRVFTISVATLMITDIAHVSFADKTHWLLIALAIASVELYRRTISNQSETNRRSRTFVYGTQK